MIRELQPHEVTFTTTCEPEHSSIHGNASAIDPDTDRDIETLINRELENGNEWAWSTVNVIARWGPFEGNAYCGGCSYASKEDFIETSMYYEDMKKEALDDLNRLLSFVNPLLSPP